MSENRIWGYEKTGTNLTDRQLQLVEHYQNLNDLEPTYRDLRRVSLRDKRRLRNLNHLQAEAAKQDQREIKNALAELAAANPNDNEIIIFSDQEGEA